MKTAFFISIIFYMSIIDIKPSSKIFEGQITYSFNSNLVDSAIFEYLYRDDTLIIIRPYVLSKKYGGYDYEINIIKGDSLYVENVDIKRKVNREFKTFLYNISEGTKINKIENLQCLGYLCQGLEVVSYRDHYFGNTSFSQKIFYQDEFKYGNNGGNCIFNTPNNFIPLKIIKKSNVEGESESQSKRKGSTLTAIKIEEIKFKESIILVAEKIIKSR